MRYAIALADGEWLVREDAITGHAVTGRHIEEAQQAVTDWNARCVTRKVEPPVIDGWGPVGDLRAWLRAEDGWWGLVSAVMGCGGYAPRISPPARG